MTIEQFQELELSFIHDLKQSEPYLSCKKLSSQLEENEEIISLVKERDSLLLQAEKTEDSKEKAEVLKQYLKDAVLDNRVANEREPLMELLMKKAAEMGLTQ